MASGYYVRFSVILVLNFELTELKFDGQKCLEDFRLEKIMLF
jgi:hypothetical protein